MSAKGIRSARVSTASTALSDISTPESKVPRIFEGDNESTIIPSESLAFEGPIMEAQHTDHSEHPMSLKFAQNLHYDLSDQQHQQDQKYRQ